MSNTNKPKLSQFNYFNCRTSHERSDIVNRAFQMIEKQKEYISLLGKEIDSMVGVARAHGWKSELFVEGKRLRKEISELDGEVLVPNQKERILDLITAIELNLEYSFGDQYGIADFESGSERMKKLAKESAFYQKILSEIKNIID